MIPIILNMKQMKHFYFSEDKREFLFLLEKVDISPIRKLAE